MKSAKSMFLTSALVLGVAAAGCPSEPEYPVQPTATVPPTATTPPPVVTAPPVAATGCDALLGATFTQVFNLRVGTEAPRMQPEGSPVCGNVGEGGTVSGTPFFLENSKCYTVLANGFPNVTEVDVNLVIDASAIGMVPALSSLAAAPLAVDSDVGVTAAIGAKANCYRWQLPVPAPVKLVVKARQGAGQIGAQVYSRKL